MYSYIWDSLYITPIQYIEICYITPSQYNEICYGESQINEYIARAQEMSS